MIPTTQPASKLKLNKLQKIKSRYKTELTSELPGGLAEPAFDISRSQQFTRIYQRLSNHFNLSSLPRKMYTEKDVRGMEGREDKDGGYGNRKRRVYSTNLKHSQTKSLTKGVVGGGKEEKRSGSYNKMILPSVNPPYHHPSLSSQSLNPLLNKAYPHTASLLLHITSLASLYHHLRQRHKLPALFSSLQSYIMESNNSDISSLDELFLVRETSVSCKVFVFLERMLVVLVAEGLVKGGGKGERVGLRVLVRMVCDQWVSFLGLLAGKGFQVDGGEVRRVLELMGSDEAVKTRKLFYQNKQIIEKISAHLVPTPSLRNFFHAHLAKVPHQTINESFFSLLSYYSLLLAQTYPVCPLPLRFLSTCPSPYLHFPPSKPYTLLLDLDETLVHYNDTTKSLLVRPYCHKFVQELTPYYEIGVFTCAMPEYADWVLDWLELPVEFRLYRYHTVQVEGGGGYLKDLRRVGRGVERMVIVDNLRENFGLTPRNGVEIGEWVGEEGDRELVRVMEGLREVGREGLREVGKDVREGLERVFGRER